MSDIKIVAPITEQDKAKWLSYRIRLSEALERNKTILKLDLINTFQIHKRVFGKPKMAPSVNCCVDIKTWQYMGSNIDDACGIVEMDDPIEEAIKAVAKKKPSKKRKVKK